MKLQSPVATGITLDLLYKIKVPWMKEAVMEMKNYKGKMEEKKMTQKQWTSTETLIWECWLPINCSLFYKFTHKCTCPINCCRVCLYPRGMFVHEWQEGGTDGETEGYLETRSCICHSLICFVFLLLVTMLLSGAGGRAKHKDWEIPGLLKTINKCLCCVLSIGTFWVSVWVSTTSNHLMKPGGKSRFSQKQIGNTLKIMKWWNKVPLCFGTEIHFAVTNSLNVDRNLLSDIINLTGQLNEIFPNRSLPWNTFLNSRATK